MNFKSAIFAIVTGLLVTAAWAQTQPTTPPTTQPLNLKLPANLPASSSTAASHASSVKPASGSSAPGAYYGDTSGARETDVTPATTESGCDDSTYNNAQTHGEVGVGVVSGSRIGSGSYQTGAVNVTKNLGSCDHPAGSIGVSIGVGRLNGFNNHGGF
jgi:hypothetical protein